MEGLFVMDIYNVFMNTVLSLCLNCEIYFK